MEPVLHKVSKLMKVLPNTGLQYAFCYGSSLFAKPESKNQANTLASKEKQIDVVLVIDDKHLNDWHAHNMTHNPQHYASYWRYTARRSQSRVTQPSRAMQRVQAWGPGIWYHPYVTLSDAPDTYKYGVVSTAALVDDLQQWSHVYLAGRLHKPVLTVHEPSGTVQHALAVNHRAAVAITALLLTAQSLYQGPHYPAITCREFYAHLSGVSYRGDIRMGWAESPDKISRLVGDGSAFDAIYRPILQQWGLLNSADEFVVPRDVTALLEHVPHPLRHAATASVPAHHTTTSPAPGPATLSTPLHDQLSAIVARSSRIQTIKGLLTAGPARSIAYSMHKIRKRFF